MNLPPPIQPPANHPPPPGTPGDDRAYLDRTSGTYRYEDENGDEWEWQLIPAAARPSTAFQGELEEDAFALEAAAASQTSRQQQRGRWVKVVDEDLIQTQQAAYGTSEWDTAQEHTTAAALTKRSKKRKADSLVAPGSQSTSGTTSNPQPASKKHKPITSLYITGLPLDCTADEIASVFSRYGLLLEDDEGKPRIKMYHDDATGQFKGEALVVYFKPESVDLAINLLDETSLRAAKGVVGGPMMKVQKAQFPVASLSETAAKKEGSASGQTVKAAPPTSTSIGGAAVVDAGNGATSTSSTTTAGSCRNLTDQERRRIAKRVARMENKLTDWDSPDEDNPIALSSSSSSSAIRTEARTVVLKKMFALVELDEDPKLLLDLKEDVRSECEDIGAVSNIVLWDKEPEGVMTVKFREAEAAKTCVKKMDNRFFAGRRIHAFLIDSKPHFRKTEKPDNLSDQEKEEEKKRVDKFGSWLEGA